MLRRLSWREWGALAEALLLLPVVAVALRVKSLAWVQTVLGRLDPATGAARDSRATGAAELAFVVHLAARISPWHPNCLQRSLVLWWGLRRRGIAADLRLGVRRDPATATPDFHAWVEHAGVVLNDRADVRQRYAAFGGAIEPVRFASGAVRR